MLTNYHTHTTFSDGKNSPEEIVLYAIEKGYDSLGFSDHSYTKFDLRYCMQDESGYIADITNLKEKYKDKIEIYLGLEEDIFSVMNRKNYDYIIQSCHYLCVDNKYYSVDSSRDHMSKALEVFNFDILKLSKLYYETLCGFVKKRNPDILGHFDIITKFEEVDNRQFLSNEKYLEIADRYLNEIVNDVIIEVNTGAMARGIKSIPYPHERLLYGIKKAGGKLILSSDSHELKTLDYQFNETKKMLSDIGFDHLYVISKGTFKKDYI